MKYLLTPFLLFGIYVSQAQFFVQQLPIDQLLNNDDAYVVTNAGDTIWGRISNVSIGNERIRAVTVKTDTEKFKFKYDELTTIAVVPSTWAEKEDMALITTLERSENDQFLDVVETDWVIYEKALDRTAFKPRYEFTQLLNPGFDSKIKVYKDWNAGSTMSLSSGSGDMLLGGDDDSYILVSDDLESLLIRKRKYKKEGLTEIYKNCPELKQEEELKWKDFARHMYVYDTKCE